jgi:DNA-binding response OmpR family regulator
MQALRIVSIEDEIDMIDLIRLILVRHGHEVIGAQGGREGLRIVQEQKPDLILLDLMMPDVDGWEVYTQLKADPSTQTIPVLIVTARAQFRDRLVLVRQTGLDDYIIKPFGPAQLIDSVERLLAHQPGGD